MRNGWSFRWGQGFQLRPETHQPLTNFLWVSGAMQKITPWFLWPVCGGVVSTTTVYREHWRRVCAVDDIAIDGGTDTENVRLSIATWLRHGTHNSGTGSGWAYPLLNPRREEGGRSLHARGGQRTLLKKITHSACAKANNGTKVGDLSTGPARCPPLPVGLQGRVKPLRGQAE